MNPNLDFETLQENRFNSIRTELLDELLNDSNHINLTDYVAVKAKSLKCSKMTILDFLNRLVEDGSLTIDRKQGLIEKNTNRKDNTLRVKVSKENVCQMCGFEIMDKKVNIRGDVFVHQGCFSVMTSEDFKKLEELNK
jgi:predicted Zn-ribbon and HTH transcriptional regulator